VINDVTNTIVANAAMLFVIIILVGIKRMEEAQLKMTVM